MFKYRKGLFISLLTGLTLLSSFAEAAVPNAPGSYVGVSKLSSTSVRVSTQDNSNNEDGFYASIYDYATSELVKNKLIPASNTDTVYADITGLVCDKLYSAKVLAFNADGNSSTSDTQHFNIHSTFSTPCSDEPAMDIPAAPGPYIGVTPIDKTSVRINFLDNADNEDGFLLFDESGDINVTIPENNATAPSDTYVTLTGLTCDRTYVIKALAFNTVGNSAMSDARDFNIHTTFEMPCDPISPDLIKVTIPFDKESISKVICATIPDSTEVFQKVDIMFLIDVSGSYGDDLAVFRARANEIISAFEEAGQDVQISVASFSDFPISPYGGAVDYAFRLDQPLTDDFSLVTTAINNLDLLYGRDGPESQLEALFQGGEAATGWREGALPIIFLATDAGFHNSDDEPDYPGHGLTETVDSLVSKGIKVFGLQSGGSIADVIEIADLTDGSVFNLSADSSEIVAAIESAIAGTSTDISVILEAIGDDGSVVESITPNIEGAVAGDSIDNVNAGDEVCFNVVFTRGIYTSDTEVRIVNFQLRIVAEGVATVKEFPIEVELFPKDPIKEAY